MKDHKTEVEIHWISGHMSVERNKKADETAKLAMEKASRQRDRERFTLLIHVRHTISEMKWKVIRYWFRMENDRCLLVQRIRYDLALESQGHDIVRMERGAKDSRRYFQLKSGHVVMGTYLKHIVKTETNRR